MKHLQNSQKQQQYLFILAELDKTDSIQKLRNFLGRLIVL